MINIMSTKLKKIGQDKYKRPLETLQDKLTKEEIEAKLEDYQLVKDISKVQIGTHIRYFTIGENGKKKFRLGGSLVRNDGLPTYVILSNNNVTWSVQTENTVFFAKLTYKELKEEYENIIEEKDKEIKGMAIEIKKLREKLDDLKSEIKSKKNKKI